MADDLKSKEQDIAEYDGGNPQWYSGRTSREADLGETDPKSSQTKAPEELKEAEGSAPDSSGSGFYKQGPTKTRGQFRVDKQKGIIGLLVGLLVGGVFGVSTIVSGPLKIIHFGQLLSKPFSIGNNMVESRAGDLIKWSRYPNNPESRRLSSLGRYVSNRVDAKFARAGLTPVYGQSGPERGRLLRYDIDTSTTSADSLRDAGITVSEDGRSVPIDPPDEGVSKSVARERLRATTRGMNVLTGSKVGVIGYRTNIRKAGLTMTNIISTRRTQNRQADADRRQRQAEYEEQKRQVVERRPTDAGTTTRVNDVGEAGEDGRSPGTPEGDGGSQNSFGSRRAAANTVRTASGVGLACIAVQISDPSGLARRARVILPLMRQAGYFLTIMGQTMSGNVDIEELGFVAEELDAVDENGEFSSAFSAAPVQHEAGEDVTGQDIPDSAHPTRSKGSLESFVSQIPGIGAIESTCGALATTAGQITGWAVDIAFCIGTAFTGCVAKGAAQAAVIGAGMNTIVSMLAGDEVAACLTNDVETVEAGDGDSAAPPPEVGGAVRGACAMHGARLLANESMISFGGRELSDTQTAQVNSYFDSLDKKEMQHKSFYARIADPYNADSLFSRAVVHNSLFANPKNTLQSVAKAPVSIVGSLSNTLTTLFGGSARANTEFDYGYNRFGFSMDELNSEDYDNPYENAEKVESYLMSSEGKSRVEGCFGMRVVGDNPQDFYLEPIPDEVRVVDEKTRSENDCADTDEQFTRLRFYVMDMMVLESMACYEGESGSCDKLGVPSE